MKRRDCVAWGWESVFFRFVKDLKQQASVSWQRSNDQMHAEWPVTNFVLVYVCSGHEDAHCISCCAQARRSICFVECDERYMSNDDDAGRKIGNLCGILCVEDVQRRRILS